MSNAKKNNVVTFPTNLTDGEREVEAILFAAAEPLDIETIESKLQKIKASMEKTRVFHSACPQVEIRRLTKCVGVLILLS